MYRGGRLSRIRHSLDPHKRAQNFIIRCLANFEFSSLIFKTRVKDWDGINLSARREDLRLRAETERTALKAAEGIIFCTGRRSHDSSFAVSQKISLNGNLCLSFAKLHQDHRMERS